MSTTEINNLTEFETLIQEKSGFILIDFYAPWCGPCKIMSPIFEKLAEDENLKDVKFVSINRDENQELIQKYAFKIPTIPRFFLIKTNANTITFSEDLGGTQSKTQLNDKVSSYINQEDNTQAKDETVNSTKSEVKRVGIIGSGPAGLTAALYSARANFEVTVFTGMEPGGQLTTTTEIENFPGAWDREKSIGVTGSELVETIQIQAEHFGAKVEFGEITKLEYKMVNDKPVFTLFDTAEKTSEFDAVIIASGAKARYLNIEGEEKYVGQGYHSCATCDGAFYKNKVVAIVGGGDTAMEEANFLTRFASKVYLLHRRSEFRASQIMLDRVKSNPKIQIVTNVEVQELVGENKLASIVLHSTLDSFNPDLGGPEFEHIDANHARLTLDGLFVAIGHDPNTKYIANLLDTDEAGYLIPQSRLPHNLRTSKYNMATEIPGIFVAGDVEDHEYRQAITAAAGGCRAAMECEKWLAE